MVCGYIYVYIHNAVDAHRQVLTTDRTQKLVFTLLSNTRMRSNFITNTRHTRPVSYMLYFDTFCIYML
jgi:hypothetical protein